MLTRVERTLFFVVYEELWRADGCNAVKLTQDPPLRIFELAAAGNTLYLAGIDQARGPALWKLDGTTTGTGAMDVIPGPDGATSLMSAGSRVFFIASAGPRALIWVSDGTEAGTRIVRTASGRAFETYSPERLAAANGLLYFTWVVERAGEPGERVDGSLWRSDGSPSGTESVRRFRTLFAPEGMLAAGSRLYFTASGGLWTSDGTRGGTYRVSRARYGDDAGPGEVRALGQRLIFEDRQGLGLWATFKSRRTGRYSARLLVRSSRR